MSTNSWMFLAGVVYLAIGIFIVRKKISGAKGIDKLVALDAVFMAVPLAVFAPEHFKGPEFVANSVPSWMPGHLFWAYFVGCALLAAATSFTFDRLMRLSSSLLGLMFFLFVCMIFLPAAIAHPLGRFGWIYALRDLSFAAGAWAIASRLYCGWSPRLSTWMVRFSQAVLAIAAIFYAVVQILHPGFAPGVPLEKATPTWMPLPNEWNYLSGLILVAAGCALMISRRPRFAAASIGALMTALVLFYYVPLAIASSRGGDLNEGLNYVADTLLYGGAALALASALPREDSLTERSTSTVQDNGLLAQ